MPKTPAQLDREIAAFVQEWKTKKSPIQVKCKLLAFGIKGCEWKVVSEFRGAEFVSRKRPGEFAIVHPSPKSIGKWQVSMFDKDGPVSDSQHSEVADALRRVSPKLWRLTQLG